jgi:hypothetical protein
MHGSRGAEHGRKLLAERGEGADQSERDGRRNRAGGATSSGPGTKANDSSVHW